MTRGWEDKPQICGKHISLAENICKNLIKDIIIYRELLKFNSKTMHPILVPMSLRNGKLSQ